MLRIRSRYRLAIPLVALMTAFGGGAAALAGGPCGGPSYYHPVHKRPIFKKTTWHGGYGHAHGRPQVVVSGHVGANPWRLLTCDPRQAYEIFQCEAQANPHNAAPRIGKAIAKGLLGDQRRAILTMNSALRYDCARLTRLPISYDLKCEINRLADSIARHAYGCDPARAWVAVSALRLISGDRYAAKSAFNRAIGYGACGPAVDNLAFQLNAW